MDPEDREEVKMLRGQGDVETDEGSEEGEIIEEEEDHEIPEKDTIENDKDIYRRSVYKGEELDEKREKKRNVSRSSSPNRDTRLSRRSRHRSRSFSRDRRRRDRSRSLQRRRRYDSSSRSRSRSRRTRRRDYSESDRRSRRRRNEGSVSPSEEKRPSKDEDEDIDPETLKRIETALEYQEVAMNSEDEEQRIIEERRKRREEILAKYQANRIDQQNNEHDQKEKAESMAQLEKTDKEYDEQQNEIQIINDLGMEGGTLNIWRESFNQASESNQKPPPEVSASALASGIGEYKKHAVERLKASLEAHPSYANGEKNDTSKDGMYLDEEEKDSDVEDIFAATPEDAKDNSIPAEKPRIRPRVGLVDNYDDAEGYYNFQVGELLAGRYEVLSAHGRGVFSSVLRAKDLHAKPDQPDEVAVKVIRANDTMYKAGQMERVILRKLAEADPEGKRHCIRLFGSFEYRNHLCLVFEQMNMDLRALTKRYGRGIGLSLSAVRVYAQQMLIALLHLKNCGVLHADIKPDNILVNDRRTVLKLCDFGSAMFAGDNEITPYLVSRFYRAPEVILGLPYDHPMDMWSVGCVVYELFTGQILFPGRTNNEMLMLAMDVKGAFPKKMLRKAEFAVRHFDMNEPNLPFWKIEEDPVTKAPLRRVIQNPSVKYDFSSLLSGQAPDKRKLAQLADLLEKMMVLDPDRRITPKEALRHPFFHVHNAPAISHQPRAVQAINRRM